MARSRQKDKRSKALHVNNVTYHTNLWNIHAQNKSTTAHDKKPKEGQKSTLKTYTRHISQIYIDIHLKDHRLIFTIIKLIKYQRSLMKDSQKNYRTYKMLDVYIFKNEVNIARDKKPEQQNDARSKLGP